MEFRGKQNIYYKIILYTILRNLKTYKKFESDRSSSRLEEGLLEYFYDMEDDFGVDVNCHSFRDPGTIEIVWKHQIVISFPSGTSISILEKFIPYLGETIKRVESIGEYKIISDRLNRRAGQSPIPFGSISVNHSLTTLEYIFLNRENLNFEYLQNVIDSKFHETIIDELEVVDVCLDFSSRQRKV